MNLDCTLSSKERFFWLQVVELFVNARDQPEFRLIPSFV